MSDLRLTAVAALCGAAVMMLELMGVRLAAPWFGQSQLVWTNVIGVVLAALAAGQWLGGRWAEGRGGPGPATLLLAAGALGLAQPELVALIGPAVLPDELGLLEAYPFVTWGSLVVAMVALGTPMLALGAVTPWLVRLSADVTSAPGVVAGRLLGAGTLGSLVGTFCGTHVLLPAFGSAGTVRTAGLLLVLAGVLMWDRNVRLWSVGCWFALASAIAARPDPAPLPGLLESRETVYQLARVIELDGGTRALLLNEGLDSYHSLRPAQGVLTGAYYDAFLMPALMAPPSADGRADVLVVGLAAGTMAWQLERVAPQIRVTGVEIDAEVVDLGRRWFDLPDATVVHAGVDGRVAVSASDARFGAILVDAFAEQIYVPAHLATVEAFATLHRHLLPGGVVALNVGGLSLEDPVVAAVVATLSQVFGSVQAGRVPSTRNMLVLGWRDDPPGSGLVSARLEAAGLASALEWTTDAERLAPADGVTGRILRDGNAPVEELAHASWRREWRAQPAAGRPLDDALDDARRLLRATRWTAAEQRLLPERDGPGGARRAECGLLLGNIAFERGDLAVARERWVEARAEAAGASGLRSVLDQNLALVEDALVRRAEVAARADSVRDVGLGLGLLAVVVVGVLRRRGR